MLPPVQPPTGASQSPFPLLYQAQHRDYQADLPFWLTLADELGDPILELGCGTGRVLIPLAEADHTVYGLDIDPGMLALCQQAIPERLNAQVWTIQADLTAFQLETRFPLVILPCNTYSTLSEGARKSALTCIHKHLLPGGVFATSFPNPALMAHLAATTHPEFETSFFHPETGNPVQISYEIKRASGLLTLVWHYDHLFPDGQVRRFTHRVEHQLVTTTQYLDEFDACGFSILATYGDFERSPLNPASPDLVIVSRQI